MRYVGTQGSNDDPGIFIDPNYFAAPDEWRTDGQMAANSTDGKGNAQPLMRSDLLKFEITETRFYLVETVSNNDYNDTRK